MSTQEICKLPEEIVEEAISALKRVLSNYPLAPLNIEYIQKTHADLLKAFRNS